MVKQVIFTSLFKKEIRKIDNSIKEQAKKRIKKIIENPDIGKPLRHNLKGEREVYVKQFRLIYAVINDELFLLKFRHKDEAGSD